MQRFYVVPRRGLLVVLAAALLLAGCGGGDSGSGETYGGILHGLKRAALAGASYEAVKRAEDLKPALKASIDAFCEVNQEMLLNQEAWKAVGGAYYLSRIKLRAERELPFVSTVPVNRAVMRYWNLFDLASFEPADVRRYERPCYR
jgi:hypothetical protein